MLYIDPEVCIDCEACVPKCPVEGSFSTSEFPSNGGLTSRRTPDGAGTADDQQEEGGRMKDKG